MLSSSHCSSYGGARTTTPALCVDSINGLSHNRDFGDEEDEEEVEVQQASGETVFSHSQELFFTLDLVPSQPTEGGLPDLEGGEGTSEQTKMCSFIGVLANYFKTQLNIKLIMIYTSTRMEPELLKNMLMSLTSTSCLAVELLLMIQSDSEGSDDIDATQWHGHVSLTGTRTTVALPRNLYKHIAQVLDETFEEITEADYHDVREHINSLFCI
ncbi:hypothetical protein UY3_13611 [Chelonia mydas]|uniref:Uncharacterized protein n=1 Tax=Chelonia mydas TaxID=8469 RepID=M7BAT6_CHEMY|nr:hypothetical protein UY3_13611 [Chelonia mydas]